MPLDKPQHLLEERVAQSTPCILRLDASLLVAHSQLWLDGLHLDVQRAEAEMYAFESLYVIEILPARPHWPELPALWMTDVAVVGNIHVFEKKEVSINGLLAIDTTVLLESAPPRGPSSHIASMPLCSAPLHSHCLHLMVREC